MARQGWGRHSTVATGSDSGDQVSVNAWNADIDKDGMLGFTGETIASATSITPTSTTLILSGSTNVSTIATTNTAEYDLLYIFTSGTVTLVNTSSPSSAGDIKLLANANTDLSQSVPTILIRKGNFWYEYGGSPVTDASITFAKIQNLATMKVIGRTAASTGVSSEVAILDEDNMASDSAVSLATQQSIKAYVDSQDHNISDGEVTNAKLADMAANTIKVRDANSSGVPSDKAVADTQILIGDGTGFTAAALSGQATMTNAGIVTIGTLNQNTTGTAATVTGAAQTAITSVGTLTALSVDNLTIDANKIEATNTNGNIQLDSNGTGVIEVLGNTNDGSITLNCTSNSHGQTIKSQPHSAAVTNTMLLPQGASSTLVSLVSADTLTNKTLVSPAITTSQTFVDNSKSIYGSTGTKKLNIYHDGSNSYIQGAGSAGYMLYYAPTASDLHRFLVNNTTVLDINSNGLDVEGDIRLQDAAGTEYVGIEAPTTVTGSYILKLPPATGATGEVLKMSSTANSLEWGTAGGGATVTHDYTIQTSSYTGGNASGTTRSVFIRTIDSNNEGVFVKIKKNGTADTEVQIA